MAFSSQFVLLVSCLAALASLISGDKACTLDNKCLCHYDNKVFDITALKGEIIAKKDNDEFDYNPCEKFTKGDCKDSLLCDGTPVTPPTKWSSIIKADSSIKFSVADDEKSVKVIYNDGAQPKATVTFVCDPTKETDFKVTKVEKGKNYEFSYTSKNACVKTATSSTTSASTSSGAPTTSSPKPTQPTTGTTTPKTTGTTGKPTTTGGKPTSQSTPTGQSTQPTSQSKPTGSPPTGSQPTGSHPTGSTITGSTPGDASSVRMSAALAILCASVAALLRL